MELPVRTPKRFPCTPLDKEWLTPPYALKDHLLPTPRADQSVWPGQCCPEFRVRRSEFGLVLAECWSCRHADFHLDRDVALDVGICRYPRDGMESTAYQ